MAIEIVVQEEQTSVSVTDQTVIIREGEGGSKVQLRISNGYLQYSDDGVTWFNIATVQNGADGYSPIVDLSKSGKATTLKVTDANGTKSAVIYDGADGKDGASGTGTGITVPDYWKSELEAGAKAINAAICAAGFNKSSFLFYSDSHWDYGAKMSPTLLKYLYLNTAMSKTFFGGDIVNTEAADADTMAYLWDWRKQIKDLPNHHSVAGNHDDGNSTDHLLPIDYVYGYLMAAEETPDIVRGATGLYYYIDSPGERTRYLFLDTGCYDLNALSDAQSTFIKEALKSAPSGWHIVVVSHIWYVPDYNQYDIRPIPIAGLSDTASAVAAILDNYNSRSGEFSGCGATVEFCIGGHVHRDYTGTTNGGIPIIVVETDSWHIRSGETNTAGTATEASVSGIVADYDSDTLTVIRVGRGSSFTVDLSSGESTDIPGGGDTGDDSGDNGGNEPVVPDPEPEPEPEPEPDNLLDSVGYQTGYRLNSSGKATGRADRSITGFINAGVGDTIYFKNVTTVNGDYGRNIAHYTSNSEDAFITGKSYLMEDSVCQFWPDGELKSFTIGEIGTQWVRFCFAGITDDSIITKNEPLN